MAIEYRFLDRDDETLIKTAELPLNGGIAVAVRTTGYDAQTDEIVELAAVDLSGNELFCQMVKPQNIEDWPGGAASGGITPADVTACPELFQFEDDIRELFENASVVVGQHVGFIGEMVEASWVALPQFKEFDLLEEFCASHSAADYPNQPAPVASLAGIAGYYEIGEDGAGALGEARTVAACYAKVVEEHAQVRAAKGEQYWERYREQVEEAERADVQLQAAKRNQEIRALRVNAIMWLCAAAIFSNLAVQLHIRGFDFGFVAVAAVAAVFFTIRWAMSLYAMFTLRKGK